MQTILSPLAARMVFKLMPGSVKDDFVPILWSGARGVYRGKRCRWWVKMRKSHSEHFSTAVPQKADIASARLARQKGADFVAKVVDGPEEQ